MARDCTSQCGKLRRPGGDAKHVLVDDKGAPLVSLTLKKE
jgi:hypothetical protein